MRATPARRAKNSRFAEKTRRAVCSRKTESPIRSRFSQERGDGEPILSLAPRNGFGGALLASVENSERSFAKKFNVFRQKKRSIPFFASAATYKSRRRTKSLRARNGLARFDVDRKHVSRSLDRFCRRLANSAQGKAAYDRRTQRLRLRSKRK
ncbi:MAG: hypothetical protein IKU86_04150 [Thermoguttaceae bacterium]|nr:hypothetical protein [Thermoguttaceae bacterium]